MFNKHSKLYEFDEFLLTAEKPSLWQKGRLVSIPPKALEVLVLLVERNGEIVSREELLETVWKGTFVEESNINYTISLLRKTLGGGKEFIKTVPKRGYRFVVPINIKIETDARARGNNGGAGAPPETEITSEPNVGIPEADPPPPPLPKQTLPSLAATPLASKGFEIKENKVPEQKSFFPRNRAVYFALGLIVLFAAAAAVGLFVYSSRTPQPGSSFKPLTNEMRFQRLTDTGDVAYLVISPDGEAVAFTREKDLFLRDLQSGGELKLNVENEGKLGCLQFSADGKFIYFGSYLQNSLGKISKVSRFGGTPKMVTENVWSGFSLSPDGRSLAFNRKFPSENRNLLVVKDLETGAEKTLAEKILPEQYYWNNYPAWSPDGKKIAVVVDSLTEHFIRLIAIDVETGGEEEIKTLNFRNVEQVVWLPDQKSLIASANNGDNFQLWQIAYPGGETRRITNDLNSYLGISISRDGRRLLSRQRIYYSNIWVGRQENLSNLEQLTVGTARNDGLKGLSWLDNQKIVYTSNAEKLRDWNLWVVDSADKSRQELTVDSNVQNDRPVASPDGEVVYFSSNRATSAHIWRVNSSGEKLEQVTRSERETELYPQVSPDGAWLYFLRKKPNSTTIWRKSLADGNEEELMKGAEYAAENFLSLSADGKFLAFQNLPARGSIEEKSGEIRIGIVSTENPKDIRFFKLPVASDFITWKAGEAAFDYAVRVQDGSQIMRQKLDGGSKPAIILKIPKEDLFGFAWSRDGQKIALARGQLLRDVVLLTDFVK